GLNRVQYTGFALCTVPGSNHRLVGLALDAFFELAGLGVDFDLVADVA
ncbi:MAG: hypothetical protein ACI8UD_003538, partial [Planctomycetota bacterium]